MRTCRLWMALCLPWLAAAGQAASPSVAELAWLAGHWRAENGENLVEEAWSDPRAGVMTGSFRLLESGEVRVLEYLVVSQEADGVFYRFKHFRPDYSTWEGDGPPLDLRLVESAPGRAVFRNTREAEGEPSYISYLLGDDGRLAVLVGEAPVTSGEYRGFRFVLTRQGEAASVAGGGPGEKDEMPIDQKINYLELPARDLDAVQAFYEGAFGWSFTDYGPEYRAFNDGSIDGGFYKAEASSRTASGAALIVLYAEDLAAARGRVLDNGGAIVRDIFSFPGGRRFHFADPGGNELAVWSDR